VRSWIFSLSLFVVMAEWALLVGMLGALAVSRGDSGGDLFSWVGSVAVRSGSWPFWKLWDVIIKICFHDAIGWAYVSGRRIFWRLVVLMMGAYPDHYGIASF